MKAITIWILVILKWENGVCSIDEDEPLDKKTKQICRKLSLEMFLEQKKDSYINYMIVYKNPLFELV